MDGVLRRYLELQEEHDEQVQAIAHLELEAARHSSVPWEIESELRRRRVRLGELETELDDLEMDVKRNGRKLEPDYGGLMLGMMAVHRRSKANSDTLRAIQITVDQLQSARGRPHPNRSMAVMMAALLFVTDRALFVTSDFRHAVGIPGEIAVFGGLVLWGLAALLVWLTRST